MSVCLKKEALSKIMMRAAPTQKTAQILKASWLDTPLGPMLAIGDEITLHLLEFVDRRGLEQGVEYLQQKTKSAIIFGETKPIQSIENEIKHYFNGELQSFKTPLFLQGSPFQKSVWEELRKIPYGKTCSYFDIALSIEKPSACRAVAGANGANRFAIVIPCHRVIHSDGSLSGYAGGVARKQWLINFEKLNIS